jgi:nitrite reductase/ring-hydroxylating ferredoxin subunit
MNRDEQTKYIKKLKKNVATGSTDRGSELAINDPYVYRSLEFLEAEIEKIFLQDPQVIGLSADLPQKNSFFTANLLDKEIIATRDSNGLFRVFLNSCRHRGALITTETRGCSNYLTCGFHGWKYSSSGELSGVHNKSSFGEVPNDFRNLIELPSLEWGGFLICKFEVDSSNSKIDIDSVFTKELQEELLELNIKELDHFDFDLYEVECNWKLAVDSFAESYHFKHLHNRTLDFIFYGDSAAFDSCGKNYRILVPRKEIDQVSDGEESKFSLDQVSLAIYWLYPNVVFIPFEGGCYLLRLLPATDDPSKHTSSVTFYLRPGTDRAADMDRFSDKVELAQLFNRIVKDEDYSKAVEQQRNFTKYSSLDRVIYGRNEPGLQHFHSVIQSAVGIHRLKFVEREYSADVQ